jgi:hypothetical protein
VRHARGYDFRLGGNGKLTCFKDLRSHVSRPANINHAVHKPDVQPITVCRRASHVRVDRILSSSLSRADAS